jgi:hypothetical protein
MAITKRVRRVYRSAVALVIAVAVVAIVTLGVNALLLGAAELVSSVWPGIALPIYGTFVAMTPLFFLLGRVPAPIALAVVREQDANSRSFIWSFTYVQVSGFLLLVVGASEFLRYWNLQFGGFSGQSSDYWSWLWYGTSWVLDNGLANFSQIYGWQVSDIRPTTMTTQTLVWIYNILVEVFAVTAIVRAAQAMRRILAQVDD